MTRLGIPQQVIDLQPKADPCCLNYIYHAPAKAWGLLSDRLAKQQALPIPATQQQALPTPETQQPAATAPVTTSPEPADAGVVRPVTTSPEPVPQQALPACAIVGCVEPQPAPNPQDDATCRKSGAKPGSIAYIFQQYLDAARLPAVRPVTTSPDPAYPRP